MFHRHVSPFHHIILTTMAQKILFTLLLQLTFALSAFAQSDEVGEYLAQNSKRFLTVKGLELKPGLLMEDALKAFEAKGWEQSKYFDHFIEKNNTYVLNGTFYNRRDCNIFIVPTSNNKNIVKTITICLPDYDTFKGLKNEYDNLKADLSEKYHMVSSTESFDDEAIEGSTLDKLKLLAISRGEARFETEFHLSENKEDDLLGYIILCISHTKNEYNDSFYVSIMYRTYDDIMEQINASDDL